MSKEKFRMLISLKTELDSLQIIKEEVVLVNWEHLEKIGEALRKTNVLAAHTSVQSRFKLYCYLEVLGG